MLNNCRPSKSISCSLYFLLFLILPFYQTSVFADYFSNGIYILQKKLVKDGFKKAYINDLYSRPGVGFEPNGISIFFTYRESKLNYDQFASNANILKAQAYMTWQKEALERAEATYGVDKTVITGIILIETKLGLSTGRRSVLNSLSSIAALNDQQTRTNFYRHLTKKHKVSLKRYFKKAGSRSEWAYRELKALLKYTTLENIDPEKIKGSIAGALGICQFMPSNIHMYGKDGNGDGHIDLFEHADAISSVANYLKRHGWKKDIDQKKKFDVIYRYNHSEYYVNTVLKISSLLKG